jgi:hypothetical protein
MVSKLKPKTAMKAQQITSHKNSMIDQSILAPESSHFSSRPQLAVKPPNIRHHEYGTGTRSRKGSLPYASSIVLQSIIPTQTDILSSHMMSEPAETPKARRTPTVYNKLMAPTEVPRPLAHPKPFGPGLRGSQSRNSK